MKRLLRYLVTALILAPGTIFPAFPEDSSAPPALIPGITSSPTEGLPAWLELGGQIRLRFETPGGTSLLNDNPDGYTLSRLRLDFGVKPISGLRFFLQAQDARTEGYQTAPAPATLYDPIDLRQAYVEWSSNGPMTMRLRAGRQELLFGGERLIGSADWGMSRTFDALDFSLSRGRTRLDLLAGSAVQIDATRLDRHKPGEHFYGAYSAVKDIVPGVNLEPYLLFKQNLKIKSESGLPGDALLLSPGVRITGRTRGRFDYTGEFLLQRGSYATDDISAGAASVVVGWQVSNSSSKPRLSAEYNYASGDSAAKDGARNTFDQFYPSNHSYYGMIDQFGWKNMKNYRAGFDFVAFQKLKVRADFNEFYLATTQDALYNSSGSAIVVNRSAASARIGSELNAVALYQCTKIWRVGAGMGHLYPGGFLKQSKYAFGYTYPYVMLAGSF